MAGAKREAGNREKKSCAISEVPTHAQPPPYRQRPLELIVLWSLRLISARKMLREAARSLNRLGPLPHLRSRWTQSIWERTNTVGAGLKSDFEQQQARCERAARYFATAASTSARKKGGSDDGEDEMAPRWRSHEEASSAPTTEAPPSRPMSVPPELQARDSALRYALPVNAHHEMQQ